MKKVPNGLAVLCVAFETVYHALVSVVSNVSGRVGVESLPCCAAPSEIDTGLQQMPSPGLFRVL